MFNKTQFFETTFPISSFAVMPCSTASDADGAKINLLSICLLEMTVENIFVGEFLFVQEQHHIAMAFVSK